jgi:hypothetical protein
VTHRQLFHRPFFVMRSFIIALALFCVAALASDVVVLTPDNFYDVVNGEKNVLVGMSLHKQ